MTKPSMLLRGGFLLLLLNSGYLYASAAPTVFYAANVLLHVSLGTLLSLLALKALPRWRRALAGRAALLWWLGVSLGASAVTGLALILVGNGTATRGLLVAHIGVSILGALTVLYWLRDRLASVAGATALVIPLIVLVASRGNVAVEPNQRAAPVSMPDEAMGGEDGPFFPSSAETDHGGTIPGKFFLGSEECGRCHTDIYEQWESSAHRKASFNNQWYRKSIEYMQSVVGVTPSKWCAGCHDHALLFSGQMDLPIAEVIDLPEAHAGLSCTSCHSITRVKDTMGNGGFVLEYPPLHDLATSKNPIMRTLHDFVLHLDPEPHRQTFLKPLHTGDSAAFCSTCHKVHLDQPVNHYRWLRGFNEYDNWQASGVSGDGARSFYYPEKPMTCVDCHMALVPGVDPAAPDGMLPSHRFAAANTAVPTAYGDQEQLDAVVAFLQAGQVSVDLFALVRSDEPVALSDAPRGQSRQLASTFAVGEEAEMVVPNRMGASSLDEEVIAPLDRVRPELVRGESVRIDAVVRTRTVGHFFPGGTVDAFDVWLELKATDENGRAFFWSGRADDDGKGPVEPGAHFYRSLLLDGDGNPIDKRNAWAARSALYVQLIPPGAANTVRFRLDIPEDAGDTIRLEAKLNYRKFAWWHTQWAYAGVRADPNDASKATPDADGGAWKFTGKMEGVSGPMKEIPDVPIVTMGSAEVVLPVVDARGAERSVDEASDYLRWNDYGIGLFRQGDLKAAERAFTTVTELAPEYAGGWVNIARVRTQEGDPEGAQLMLDRALQIDPDLAGAHYFYGLSLKALGHYDEALDRFQKAASFYPRDRVVRNQIGRIHFLKREFAQAVEELQKTLRIDPEDLEAHYNLMLAYQGLEDAEQADLHRQLYLRFKADEASQFITGDYRRQHPHDNNERLPIHEHGNALEQDTSH